MVPRSSTAPSTCAVGSAPRTRPVTGGSAPGGRKPRKARKSVSMMPIGRDDRDGELVESLRRRDAGAAECLVMTYQARAYRLAVGIRANAEDAEEVVQDALCSAIRSIDAFRASPPSDRGSIGSSSTAPPRRPDAHYCAALSLRDV